MDVLISTPAMINSPHEYLSRHKTNIHCMALDRVRDIFPSF